MSPVRAREARITDTLVELADTLVEHLDVTEFHQRIIGHISDILGAAEVGLALRTTSGHLTVMASPSQRSHALERLCLQVDEGACLGAIARQELTGPVALDDDADRRWPRFAPAARAAGYRFVLVLPLRLRDHSVGAAVALFTSNTAPQPKDVRVAQAFATAATVGLVQLRVRDELSHLASRLEHAIGSRVVIEQAKGVVSEQFRISLTDAFGLLRATARSSRRRLDDIAREIIENHDEFVHDLQVMPAGAARNDLSRTPAREDDRHPDRQGEPS
jgi:GAF domain-containing protein